MDKQVPHPSYDRKFLEDSFALILDHLQETLKGSNKVIKLKQPAQFHSLIDFSLNQDPMPKEELLELCKKVVDYSVKPYHPHFHNTLFGGFDQFSACGAIMTPLLNGNMYTYEMAPVFNLMEAEVYEYFRKILEWDRAEGLMTPGGSFGNIMSIQLARYQAFPEIREKGLRQLPPLRVFVGDNCHYSLKKGIFLCGMGSDSLIQVKSNQTGQMDPQDLDKKIKDQIQKGNYPCMISALIGSTVEGSIDDIEKISQVAKKHKVWLHVDACFGGVMFFSEKLRAKLGSCKDIDSLVFDPHKGMAIPLQCTIFMCRKAGTMGACNATNAECLFHRERVYYDNNLDTGDRSFQCGRVIDIFKLWTYLKGNGMKGVEEQINKKYDLAQELTQYIKADSEKYLMKIIETQYLNISFWCLPKQLNKQRQGLGDEEYFKRLSKVTVYAKKIMIEQGKMLLGYSSTKGSPYFWRIVVSNAFNTKEELIQEIQWLYSYCETAYEQLKTKGFDS